MSKFAANTFFLTVILIVAISGIAQDALAQTCGNSVNAPTTINGITITGAGTGSTTYPTAYTSCGNITTPANSLHLGASGFFDYTYTFSQPVNDFVFVITATGQFNNEIFTITTNAGGTPVITGSNLCFSTITGNVISSGAGGPSTGGGGIFTITNPSGPFTTLTITGPGGDAGSLFALCDASTAFVCTKPDAGNDQTGVCNGTSLMLNATSTTPGNWFPQAGNPSGATLGSTTANAASVNFSASGDYYFVFATGSCSDTVLVSVSSTVADAGTDQSISCYSTGMATMNASGTGVWTALFSNPGTSTISNTNSPTATISNFQNAGTYYYVWSVAGCGGADTVSIVAGNNCGGTTCGNSVNAPATINGINVTGSGTGFLTYLTSYTSCGNITTPANSLHLGASGTFSYTYTFSQPVNDFVFVINATGNPGNEVFVLSTNAGTPVVTGSSLCFTTIAGNVITSGAGSGTYGGGGIFSVTNPSGPFTALTISGPGGEAGSLFALCDASTAFVCTKPNAGADQTICSGASVTLNATSATAGNWFAQAGNPAGATIGSTASNAASVNFSASGDYYFVFATGSCSDTMLVSVSSTVADAGTDKNVSCYQTGSATMTASGTGVWSALVSNPGTSAISNTNSPTATISNFQNAGTYQYAWSVAGCGSADTVSIVAGNNCGCANPPFSALDNLNGSICAGQTATVTGTFSGSATLVTAATSGSGTFSALTAVVSPFSFIYTPSSSDIVAGNVNLSFITDNPLGGLCIPDTAFYTLTINPIPVMDAGVDTSLNCIITSITLTASSSIGGTTFAWSNGINSASTSISAPNTYTVTGTVNGCTASDAVVVSSIVFPPNVNAGADTTLTCLVTSVPLQASSSTAGVTFSWSNGISGANNIVSAPDTYTVTALDPANGCTASDAVVVSENITPPVPVINGDLTLSCTVLSTTLTVSASTPLSSILWDSGETINSIVVNSAGNHSVTITDAVNGCTGNANTAVTVDTEPQAVFSIVDNPCPELSQGEITSVVTGGVQPYIFNWSDNSSDSDLTNLRGGNYSVTITDQNGCSITDTFTLVNGAFDLIAFQNDSVIAGTPVQLNTSVTGGSGSHTLNWSPASFLNCSDCVAPVSRPLNTISYVVSAVDISGCTASDTIMLVVLPDTPPYIPNAFTPNGDGANDFFEVFGDKNLWATTEVKIFDRWGELLFTSTDPDFKWDGTYKSKILTPQVLTYVLNITYVSGRKEHTRKGSITLIK